MFGTTIALDIAMAESQREADYEEFYLKAYENGYNSYPNIAIPDDDIPSFLYRGSASYNKWKAEWRAGYAIAQQNTLIEALRKIGEIVNLEEKAND